MKTRRTQILIVEDEVHTAQHLQQLIVEYAGPQYQVLGLTHTLNDAETLIKQCDPDLIILDIHLGRHSGFDLLDRFPSRKFNVIFFTGFNEFAVRAFEYSATDYLVKPVLTDRLLEALDRSAEKDVRKEEPHLQMASDFYRNQSIDRIAISDLHGFEVIKITEIVRCEGEGGYTSMTLEDGNKKMTSKSLGHYQKLLESNGFMRVHKKHLVNLRQVKRWKKGKTGHLLMKDGELVPVSPQKRTALFEALNNQIYI